MFRKIIALSIVLILSVVKVYALSADDISAECAVLITAQTGEVIFAKNENKRHSMASTTKIMTSLLAVESGRLSEEIRITDDMLNVEGTSMGLLGGDSVSLRELAYGMLLPSGNDAASVTAFCLGGSVDNFAVMMNERAKSIGMKNTNFVTPSGLDDENHYSTAYDMALLGREAVKNPEFLNICSSQKATLTYGNPPYERTLYNHNRMLTAYEGALGIKTGFTKKSGRCLVSYAQKNGVGLIAVTLNDGNDWYDHKQIFDYGFSQVTAVEPQYTLPETIPVVGGLVSKARFSAEKFVLESTDKNVSYKYYLPHFLYAPLNTGDVVGRVEIFADGKLIKSISLTATENVSVKA
ncbi:MAG: D-alanyl-D-alanine carboxypeptidase [Clostridia bacterium]|nr:D-alanyl-D-alanine carboxypeptidase [Clostridia bacterium]